MRQYHYTIKDRMGIHTRPAGLFVNEANKYESKIIVMANGKTAHGQNLTEIMDLDVESADQIDIEIDGPDEDAAFDRIKSFFEDNY
ncbi:MAG: HPr family phosphocarrier protein [Eubacterium sp.]|nr:HPr family phosphocarrier protein [Eubacterium sp.]